MADTQRRRSVFRETGLDDEFDVPAPFTARAERPSSVRFRSKPDIHVIERYQDLELEDSSRADRRKSVVRQTSSAAPLPQSPLPVRSTSLMYRFGALAFLVATLVPLLQSTGFFRKGALPIQPVSAGVIPEEVRSHRGVDLSRRDDSPTDVCFRWAQQSAIVNGTLYLYGGQASTKQGQDQNTWNNDFLTLDLTQTWQIGSPNLTGLPQPSGPPAVALGTLWSSYDSLYVYGGEFSWKPMETPTAYSTWEYSIKSQQWIEHSNPQTSSGNSAPSNNDPVQRAAEGAGTNVPSLGRGFYFGGHLDPYTTEGWAQWVPRLYLQSLLEFTFPGYNNDQVDALGSENSAGTDGNYRNITEGGLQAKAGFTERADGLLIYVPGFGEQGILLAMAGGTNETYTQMNNIDVYDIANSTWYKQSTAGPTPTMRVNPCAGIVAAPDGSSYNIYMFGGQNLIPYGNQTQFDDMWILTVPSFTWIKVDMSKQSVPYGRSGHTCNVWNGQMVMVGGYVGDQLSCESPGIYVFDMSNLQWVQQYTALSAGSSDGSESSAAASSASGTDASATASASEAFSTTFNSTGANNPFNQQVAQMRNGNDFGGLEGSYGYQVPEAVISVIGGGPTGGATVTTPVATATAGPMATGKPVTYTVTNADGATVTETAAPGTPGSTNNGGTASSDKGKSGPNIGAIVAGVIAGLLFILVCYLLFCTYIYRKQLKLYKNHVEMSQRQARGEKVPAIPGLLASDQASKSSSDRRRADNNGIWTTSDEASRYSHQHTNSNGGSTGGPSGSGSGYQSVRRSSSSEDLLAGREPTFVGVLLNPRRSLRVVNKD